MENKIPFNFLSIPEVSFEKAKFIIFPIGYECTLTGNSGTKFAPISIIYSSRNFELFDEELEIEPYEIGIKTEDELEIDFSSPEKMIKKIEKKISSYLKKNKFVIGIGGEHTITLGLFRAYKRYFNDLNYICLDAHSDLREKYNGTKYSHACVNKRIYEENCSLYILGVRSISKEEFEFLKGNRKIKIYYSYQMKKEKWMEKIINEIPSGKYYLSIDVDFFDPSLIPETGTPEPGGFYWEETNEFLKNLIFRKDIEICGFDLVELSPSKIFTSSSLMCGKLIYKIIGYLVAKWKNLKF
ncbi:MAG: agmatinase [Candidatus Omnitrophica bacterium]|nr:agmatinase [Candidatus Omnitrophota bacterium]MCM8807496.1 agmatinase [Candidatus Omnitrophota bacterium]